MLLKNTKRAMKVYTKTGDGGTTGLLGGTRHSKTSPVFEVLGTNDELSSHIGLARAHLHNSAHHTKLQSTSNQLLHIQQDLQTINARIAGSTKTTLDAPKAALLEAWIDKYDTTLPPLCNFILPGGGIESAQLHVARAVCRRAERLLFTHLTAASTSSDGCDSDEARYMNRLSDYLFTAARHVCLITGNSESIYDYKRS